MACRELHNRTAIKCCEAVVSAAVRGVPHDLRIHIVQGGVPVFVCAKCIAELRAEPPDDSSRSGPDASWDDHLDHDQLKGCYGCLRAWAAEVCHRDLNAEVLAAQIAAGCTDESLLARYRRQGLITPS